MRILLAICLYLAAAIPALAQGTFPGVNPIFNGTVTLGTITGSVQCLQVNSSGQITGVNNACNTLTIGTTPITGGINSDCLIVSGGLLGQQPSCGGGGGGTNFLAITRAQIPATNIGANVTIMVSGYRTSSDIGFGAVYTSVGATCPNGLMAIKDAANNCFNMVPPNNAVSGFNPGWFGAKADGGATTITAADITANPQWRGTYSAGQSWDYVAVQEAIYAAWASASTPGSIVWNFSNSTINNTLNFSPGNYGINTTLFAAVSGFSVFMPPKNGTSGTSLMWTGPAGTGTIWKFDSASYGQFFNFNLNCGGVSLNFVAGQTAPPDIPCALFVHDGSSPGGLLTQQITFYDSVVIVGHQAGGMAFNPGSNIQGDTITFINPIFISSDGTSYYGLEIGGDNSLEYVIIDGDFQGFPYFPIFNQGGQVFTYGTHFESQNTQGVNVSPQLTQLTVEGADVYTGFSVSTDNPSMMIGAREEAENLTRADSLNAATNIYNVISVGADNTGPFTSYTGYQNGMTAYGLGTQQRAFMVVDNGGFCSQWCTVVSNNGNATITVGETYTVNALVGKIIFMRFGSNGFTYHCGIASNTANTITIANTCPNLPVSSESKYQIGGTSGGTLPNWDSATTGYRSVCRVVQCGSATTAVTTAGSNCVGLGSQAPSVANGDWLVLPGADLLAPAGSPNFSWPFYARATAASVAGACPSGLATGSHVLVNKNATVTADLGANNLDIFGGTPLTDGNISWINFHFSPVESAPQVQGLVMAGGYLSPPVTSVTGYLPGQLDFAYDPDMTVNQFLVTNANQPFSFVSNGSLQSWECQPNWAATMDLTNCSRSSSIVQITLGGNTTLNAPVPPLFSTHLSLIITGTGNVTFGTNFNSSGILVATGGVYVVDFISTTPGNGFSSQNWTEITRTQLPPGALLQTVIASLPTCAAGTLGMLAVVTNGVASPTYNAAVSTTGAANQLVFCNGTGWTYH